MEQGRISLSDSRGREIIQVADSTIRRGKMKFLQVSAFFSAKRILQVNNQLFFRSHRPLAPPESGPFQRLIFYSVRGERLISTASMRPTILTIMPMLTTNSKLTTVLSMSPAELRFILTWTMKMVCYSFVNFM